MDSLSLMASSSPVLDIRGVPSNPVPGAGGDHIPIKANKARRAELGEDDHVPALEREECDTRTTVVAPDPTVRRMYVTRPHIRAYGATEGCPDARVLKRADQCYTTSSAGRGS